MESINNKKIKAFIAVEIPKKIKSEILKIQNCLKKAGLEAKWIRSENVHLTVTFLGSINDRQTTQIKKILTPMNRFIEKPIQLLFGKISAFSNVLNARIIFVDLSGEIEKLSALAVKIRNELKNKKIWFDEKPFVAHITLGRFKKPQNLSQLVQKFAVKKIPFAVKEISLYQSQLSPAGSIYSKL